MHLQRISDGTVAEGVMYIPSSLSVKDFTEITHEEYLQIVQAEGLQSDAENTDPTIEQLNRLVEQTNENSTEITNLSTEITNLQEALCEVYESII
jgi:Uma2 family endonuclease